MHTPSGNHTESKHPLFEEHRIATERGENARSGGGKPISLERRKAGQLHMRLHSWRQASERAALPPSRPPLLRPLLRLLPPTLGGPLRRHVRWSDLQTAAAAANGYCATRPAPGDRPGSRSLREMKGRESAEHRSDTQPRWSVTPNPGPLSRVRPCQRFCRRLYRCRRHTALKQTVPVHTLSRRRHGSEKWPY